MTDNELLKQVRRGRRRGVLIIERFYRGVENYV